MRTPSRTRCASAHRQTSGLFSCALWACVSLAPSLARGQTAAREAVDDSTAPAAEDRHTILSTDGAFVTDVTDAFDPHTTWAPRFSMGFSRTQRNGTLQRERSPISSGLNPDAPELSPSGVTELDDVARYSQSIYTLHVGAELPVFHDLSLSLNAPIVLADQRAFEATGRGVDALRDGFTVDGQPGRLFNLPFKSPDRAGIDQIRLALNWNLLNQARDIHLPTWLLRLEWRIPVGSVMSACESLAGGTTRCPQLDAPRPTDPIDSTSVMSTPSAPAERPNDPARSPGISRGVHGLFVQTVISRRYGFFEPFLGIDLLAEIPGARLPQFLYGGDRPFGQLSSLPPIKGGLTVGTEIVPWENREHWQRFAIDLRVRGEYHSQGRDFTPLFDALGTSNSVPLTAPAWSVRDGQARAPMNALWFTGTTTVQSHAKLGAYFGLNMQASRHVRFVLAGSFLYTTPHAFTATDACNPNETSNNPADRGGCQGSSVPDPQHRIVIDSAGSRFRMSGDVTWDIAANLTFTPRVPW
jgi:hypothetical protein